MILTITFDATTGLGTSNARYAGIEPELAANEVVCSADQYAAPGQWKLAADGKTILPATATDLAPTKTQLAAYASAKQAKIASGGLSVNVAASGAAAETALADTDVSGRLNLSGLVQLATINSSFTTVWVQSTGNLTLSASQVIDLGMAVGMFVEASYQTLASVLADITSGKLTTTAAVDAAAWPSTSV